VIGAFNLPNGEQVRNPGSEGMLLKSGDVTTQAAAKRYGHRYRNLYTNFFNYCLASINYIPLNPERKNFHLAR
jgi:hypothetical protein